MAGLVLKLRAHEAILVNGVVIQNGERNARLTVRTPNVHILRLRDAIRPDEVDTPVRRICYLAQLAVSGELDPHEAAARLERGIGQIRDALGGLDGSEHLDLAIAELRGGNFYAVLRSLRRVLPLEARLLAGSTPGPPGPSDRGEG